MSRLVVARAGHLVATGDAREPYRMVGPGGEVATPVSVFLRDLLASGKSESTLRSYSVDLLRWWRFLDAVGIAWSRASRVEARDFSCWIQLTAKQRLQTPRPRAARLSSRAPGAPNPVTDKPASGDGYAPSTVAHSETVLRSFYDFQRDSGTGSALNPFPLDSSRRGRRRAHHNPMDEWVPEWSGRYRPVVPKRIPRAIPDDWFNKVFASLPSDRDRALVAFWISTGAGAAELLGMRQCDFLPGEQLISVVRKGTRAVQQLPASADAFVWHRLYQQELLRLDVPESGNQAVKDGALGAVMQRAAERWKPEAMYFTTFDGQRTAFMVFDMPDASGIPPFAEPFFTELNASVQLAPAMNGEDLQKGLSQLG